MTSAPTDPHPRAPSAVCVRLNTAVLVMAAVACVLTACAVPRASDGNAEQRAAVHKSVADVARHLYQGPTDTIDDYARWADAALPTASAHALTPIEMIGYEAYPGTVHGEPFGALRFRATPPRYDGETPEPACFESRFDFWGVVTPERAGWDDDDAVAPQIDCPADAHRVDPPVDTRPVYVVPDGAEKVVIDVLESATPAASADDILAEARKRMPQPTGDREVAFDPAVVVAEGRIGFAMGNADSCLLVVRDAVGVRVLNVPHVLLQPGELGCSPRTALLPDDQLRSPH